MDNGGDGKFWTLHFGVGIAMSILAPAIVLARTFSRADVPTRGVSVALAVFFLAAVPALLWLTRRILASNHLLAFLYVCDGLGFGATVVWVALDDGGQSP